MAEKRKRGANFTNAEMDILFEIVADHKNIIENKKTDAVTWREKESAWEKIASNFNATSTIHRSMDSLRKCYQNKKKVVRAESAQARYEYLKTGGGPADMPRRDPHFEIISAIVNEKSVSGIQNKFDMDNIGAVEIELEDPSHQPVASTSAMPDNNKTEENCEVNWGDFKAPNLKMTMSPQLKVAAENRKRPRILAAGTSSTSSISDEYSFLAKKKCNVRDLQHKLLEMEVEFKKKEYEKKLIGLDIDNEQKRLQLKLLEHECELKGVSLK